MYGFVKRLTVAIRVTEPIGEVRERNRIDVNIRAAGNLCESESSKALNEYYSMLNLMAVGFKGHTMSPRA